MAFHPEDVGSTYLPTNSHDDTNQNKAILILRECSLRYHFSTEIAAHHAT